MTETNGLTRNIDLRLELQSYSRLLLTTSRLGGHNMDCIFILVSISFNTHYKWDLILRLCTATTTIPPSNASCNSGKFVDWMM